MAIDGIFLHHLIQELQILQKGRISKIKQLSSLEMLFVIRSQGTNHQLVLSASAEYARIQLSNQTYEPDTSVPTFLMVTRKYFDGAIIESVEQIGADRIVRIRVKKRNELGDIMERSIILEIMGKHSNMILEENGKILDAIKRVPPFQNTFRTILPGFQYHTPEQKESNPFDHIELGTFEELMKYQGISPVLANECILRESIEIIHGPIRPVIQQGKKETFYYTPISNMEILQEFASLNELLDVYYFNRNQTEKIKQKGKDLTIFIKNELEKNANKLEKLKIDLQTSLDADHYRISGEILLNNQSEIKKGMTEVTLLNFYTNETILITLDEKKTPIQNANQYFTKYQKAKKAVSHLNTQLRETELEIEYFELLTQQITDATINDIEEIRAELEDKHYLRRKTKRSKQKPNFTTYIVDGVEILVGRNNLQNEYVTHTLAQKYDIWMHAQQIPGSHVVIKSEFPNEEILRAAANLAAYHSKAKTSSSVPVDYTYVRYIKKIPGKVMSFVTYTNQKTIYIDPDEQAIMLYMKK